MEELKANPNRYALGTVIESKLDKNVGSTVTLLVQNGTIKVGDIIVVGNTYGKIRAMQDELGKQVLQAGPSKPVEITGIAEVPCAGEKFMIFNDERKAREVAETRAHNKQKIIAVKSSVVMNIATDITVINKAIITFSLNASATFL